MTPQHDSLFAPFTLGDMEVSNRVIMSPLTRSRASQPGDVLQRHERRVLPSAGHGMIIAEATQVPQQGLRLHPGSTPRRRSRAGSG